MWYVALKRGLKKTAPEQGIKGFQQSALSNLPRDQSIIMELRVALDDTCYLEKSKKYQTRCISIATATIGNEQDSNNDFDSESSDVEYSQNGRKKKKSLKKKTTKLGKITGCSGEERRYKIVLFEILGLPLIDICVSYLFRYIFI